MTKFNVKNNYFDFFLTSILYIANSLGGFDFECFYQKKSYFEKTYISEIKKISALEQKSFFSFYVIFIITWGILNKSY